MISVSESLAVAYNRSGIFVRKNCSFSASEVCFGTHWHDRIEFILVHSGSLNIDFGERTALVPCGSVAILPPKQPHSASSGENGVCYDSVSFDLRPFYNQTAACSNLLPLIFEGRMKFELFSQEEEIFSSVVSISKEAHTDAEQLMIVGEVYRLLSLVIHNCVTQITEDANADNNFMGVIEYINSNYQSNINTSELCKVFGYTKPYFCRKFKEYTGVSPMMYLKSRRLEAACEMLQKENTSIGNISVSCGFGDPNYFTRCFKGHFGISPNLYRKKHKE